MPIPLLKFSDKDNTHFAFVLFNSDQLLNSSIGLYSIMGAPSGIS